MSTEFYAYFANIFQKNCGLRLRECMSLRIKDIDFESNGRVFFFGALFADKGSRIKEIDEGNSEKSSIPLLSTVRG